VGTNVNVPAIPPAITMSNCTHCGGHVSDQFARVFADADGEVRACPSCAANAGIAEVAKRRALEA